METDTADPRRRVLVTVCWDNQVYCLLPRPNRSFRLDRLPNRKALAAPHLFALLFPFECCVRPITPSAPHLTESHQQAEVFLVAATRTRIWWCVPNLERYVCTYLYFHSPLDQAK